MIPMRLVVQGLYSIREKQDIDFTRLTESRLFGIFGPVGSGKSSLLEAISFALYGKTERLTQQDERSYNMMNLRSDELLIDFTFRAGRASDKVYRFTVQMKRNKKKFRQISLERRAYIQHGEQWEPLESNDGSEVTELSYDHFRRVVIIPQGKFQEFLHLGATERSEMLKDLFHLERFDLFDRAGELDRQNQHQFDILTGNLQQVPEVPMEVLESLTAQIAGEEAAVKRLNDKIALLTQQEESLAKQKQLEEEQAATAAKLESLKARLPGMEEKEAAAKLLQRLRQEAAPLLKQDTELKHKIAESTGEVEKKSVQVAQLKEGAVKLQNEAVFIRDAYQQRGQYKEQAEQMRKALTAAEKGRDAAELRSRISKGEELLQETREKLDTLAEKIVQLSAALETLKASAELPAFTAALQAWYRQKEKHLESLHSLQQAGQAALASETASAAALAELRMRSSALLTENENNKDSALAEALLNAADQLQQDIDSLRVTQQEVQMQASLTSFAQALQPGSPCPLCGSVHHPQLHSAEADGRKLNELLEAEKGMREKREKLLRLQQEWVATSAQHQSLQMASSAARQKTAEADVLLQSHLASFMWPDFPAEDDSPLNALVAGSQVALAEWNRLDKERSGNEAEAGKLRADLDRFREAVEKFRQDAAALEAVRTQLLEGNPYAAEELPIYETEKAITALDAKYLAAQSAFESSEEKTRHNAVALAEADKQLTALLTEAEFLSASLAEVTSGISAVITANSLGGRDELETLLQQTTDTSAVLREAEQLRNDLLRTQTTFDMLTSRKPTEPYDAARHESVLLALSTAREAAGESLRKVGALSSERNEKERFRLLRIQLDADHRRATERKEDLAVLRNLLKANGFVNYVSAGFLQGLCAEANERFMLLTGNRLSLEMDAQNNFVIRDYLNAGQTRSVKTLSGGQTFQAALCLALALSDHLYAQHGRHQNFFFLDEGFGTLDKDALQVVFKTLVALRKENRIIGVISHVEEMQQEIETWLWLRQDAERGTLIRGSWEQQP